MYTRKHRRQPVYCLLGSRSIAVLGETALNLLLGRKPNPRCCCVTMTIVCVLTSVKYQQVERSARTICLHLRPIPLGVFVSSCISSVLLPCRVCRNAWTTNQLMLFRAFYPLHPLTTPGRDSIQSIDLVRCAPGSMSWQLCEISTTFRSTFTTPCSAGNVAQTFVASSGWSLCLEKSSSQQME